MAKRTGEPYGSPVPPPQPKPGPAELVADRAFHEALRRAAAHQGLEQDQLVVGVVGDARRGDRPLAAVAVDIARRIVVTRSEGLARSAHRRDDLRRRVDK